MGLAMEFAHEIGTGKFGFLPGHPTKSEIYGRSEGPSKEILTPEEAEEKMGGVESFKDRLDWSKVDYVKKVGSRYAFYDENDNKLPL